AGRALEDAAARAIERHGTDVALVERVLHAHEGLGPPAVPHRAVGEPQVELAAAPTAHRVRVAVVAEHRALRAVVRVEGGAAPSCAHAEPQRALGNPGKAIAVEHAG